MPFDAAPLVRSPLPDNIAGQSALVLDMTEFYFRDGQRWAHGEWWQAAREKRCLLGAVKFVRSEICSDGDQAEFYLARAIDPAPANRSGTRTSEQSARKASVAARSTALRLLVSSIVMRFNDTKGRSYSEIAAVLHKAKEMAAADAAAARRVREMCRASIPGH